MSEDAVYHEHLLESLRHACAHFSIVMPYPALKDNKTIRILEDAEKGGYGVVAAIVLDRQPQQPTKQHAPTDTPPATTSSTSWPWSAPPSASAPR